MSATGGPTDWRPRIEALVSAVRSSRQFSLPAQDPRVVDRLCQFFDTLVHWNQRMDLTAARTPDEMVDLFLADALVLAATTQTSTQHSPRWVDVGSGAGAPAIPLAILRPDLDLTLVEPKEKRVAFLRTALGELSLQRVQVRRARSSELPDASFEVACSRATLKPDDWLREGARLAGSVWVLLARGATPALPGWRAVEAHDYEWSLTRAPRRALRFARE